MQRILIRKPGGHERLEWVEEADPTAQSDQIDVAVRAAGVNYADIMIRMGLYASAKELHGYPICPGFEFAGQVLTDQGKFKIGDRVFGARLFGSYATRVQAPAEQLYRTPTNWSDAQAAGFPTVFLTAWFAFHELARPRPGEIVLIHSAAGGVGMALLQLAKAHGCRVVAVIGNKKKADQISGYQPDHILLRDAQLWQKTKSIAPNGFSAIFDANGADSLRQGWQQLASPGRLVVYGFHTMLQAGRDRPSWPKLIWTWLRTPRFSPLDFTGPAKSLMGFNLSYLTERYDLLIPAMNELMKLVEAGSIQPLAVTCFPMQHAAQAHAAMESGQSTGKLILTTGNDPT